MSDPHWTRDTTRSVRLETALWCADEIPKLFRSGIWPRGKPTPVERAEEVAKVLDCVYWDSVFLRDYLDKQRDEEFIVPSGSFDLFQPRYVQAFALERIDGGYGDSVLPFLLAGARVGRDDQTPRGGGAIPCVGEILPVDWKPWSSAQNQTLVLRIQTLVGPCDYFFLAFGDGR